MHADHVTGTGILKSLTGCNSMISKAGGGKADVLLLDNDEIVFGEEVSISFSVYVTTVQVWCKLDT